MDKKRYETRVTQEQKQILLEFMQLHSDFAKGKLLGVDGRQTRNNLWEVLTVQLNGAGGAQKTSLKWQRVWVDLKNKIKRKAGDIRRHRTHTGGGPAAAKLTEFEESVVEFLSEEAVHGIQGLDGVPLDTEEVPQNCLRDIGNIPLEYNEHVAAPNSPNHEHAIQAPLGQEPHDFTLESPHNSEYETMSVSVTETPLSERSSSSRGRKRRRITTASEAAENFTKIGQTLNKKMDDVVGRLDLLIQERQKTNEIMKEMLEVLKNK